MLRSPGAVTVEHVRHRREWIAAVVVAIAVAAGCGASSQGGGSAGGSGVDRTPERLDGSSSREFEQSDIDAANSASEAVKEYCSGAVSEAQEVGCLSHVKESDIP